MGVVGIYIHGLKNLNGETSLKGDNPFDFIKFESNGKKLSSIVKCYNPTGTDSRKRYAWISGNLTQAVEEAIYSNSQISEVQNQKSIAIWSKSLGVLHLSEKRYK